MKKKSFAVQALTLLFASMIFSMVASASPTTQDNQPAGALDQKAYDRIVKEVRHELEMCIRDSHETTHLS